jgi:hypothetical protein
MDPCRKRWTEVSSDVPPVCLNERVAIVWGSDQRALPRDIYPAVGPHARLDPQKLIDISVAHRPYFSATFAPPYTHSIHLRFESCDAVETA